MADLSQITLPNGDTYNFKDSRISASDIAAWDSAVGSGGTKVVVGTTQPSSPEENMIWFVEY